MVFSSFRFSQEVIKIILYGLMEDVGHISPTSGPCIFQTKGLEMVIKGSPRGDRISPMLVF